MSCYFVSMSKRNILLLIAFFLFILIARSENITYRFGTFNIRIATNSDEGEKNWPVRKSYVGKIVNDNRFDVIGFQEIYNHLQLAEVCEMLPDYQVVSWGRNSAEASSGEKVGVAFLTSKFTLLDQGHFFLSADPSQPLVSWDSNYSRVSVYVKLQDKQNGDIFYFFATHLDNGGMIARKEGARVNLEKMMELTGCYPSIIVGDMNANEYERGVHYTYGHLLDDSRLTCESAPIGPYVTFSNWSVKGSSSNKRIDYLYTRKMRTLSYQTINEDYGRGVTPSDHFPVLIECQLQAPTAPKNLYVAECGDDLKSGNRLNPFCSLMKAVSVASSMDTIRVGEGVYFADGGMGNRDSSIVVDKTLTIIGGYDATFSSVIGKSVLSGDIHHNDNYDGDTLVSGNDDNSRCLIRIKTPYKLTLSNFKLQGAYDEGSQSLAALYAPCYGVNLHNVEFCDNYSNNSAAALYVQGNVRLEQCIFARNKSNQGAGLYVDGSVWPLSVTDSRFEFNESKSGSAIYIDSISSGYFSCNSFSDNKSSQYGTLTCFNSETSVPLTFVNNTFANNVCRSSSGLFNKLYGGSACYLFQGTEAKFIFVNNTIVGNSSICLKSDGTRPANYYGAALYIRGGKLSLYNNIISGNYSTGSSGGDIYMETVKVDNSANNLFSSSDNMNISLGITDQISASWEDANLALSQLMDGCLDENHQFHALLGQHGGSSLISILKNRSYGSIVLNRLTVDNLNESVLQSDLDDDGSLSGILKTDQRHYFRSSSNACIGAVEYKLSDGIVPNVSDSYVCYYDGHGMLNVSADGNLYRYHIFTPSGILLKEGCQYGSEISVSDLTSGMYILVLNQGSRMFRLKFYR